MRLYMLTLFISGMLAGAEMQAIPAISQDFTGAYWRLGIYLLGALFTGYTVHRRLRKYRPLRLPRDQ